MTRLRQGLSIAGVVALAGLIGYSAGVGKWTGRMEQVVVEHERRLNGHDDALETIKRSASATSLKLARIEAKLSVLLRSAAAGEAEE